MLTDVQIINLGLSKIAASRINRIDPARTPLETYMAGNYPQWKREELTKRRWVCALEENYTLTLTDTLTETDKPYRYLLPANCLRPIRGKCSEWRQAGRSLYSAYPTLKIDYIRNISESEFDPLLNEVLACKIAMESCEYVTQSNNKKADAESKYDRAVSTAAQANAFVIGPEDIASDDNDYSWVTARYTGG